MQDFFGWMVSGLIGQYDTIFWSPVDNEYKFRADNNSEGLFMKMRDTFYDTGNTQHLKILQNGKCGLRQ